MAAVSNDRTFGLIGRTFDRTAQTFGLTAQIDFAPTGSTSATSTLTTTITSSTDGRRGTIFPGTISTASAIVGRTR
jgi:hypothetical protein